MESLLKEENNTQHFGAHFFAPLVILQLTCINLLNHN
jgi:hypothetical protein